MSKKVGTTLVPRNPVARSPLLRRGGAHSQSKTSARRQVRDNIESQLDNWREDLEFERSLKDEDRSDSSNHKSLLH